MTIRHLKKKVTLQLFTIFLRYLVGSAFVFASIVKIQSQRFTTESGANNPINSAWHLFETLYSSGIYWNFIGWGQLLAGLILMTQRWSTIGAIIFLPIIANVFIITISYEFGGTPVITFLMLLANIYLLLWDWNKLKFLFSNSNFEHLDDNPTISKQSIWIALGVFYFLLVLFMKFGSSYLTNHPIINPFAFIIICLGSACCLGLFCIIHTMRIQKKQNNS